MEFLFVCSTHVFVQRFLARHVHVHVTTGTENSPFSHSRNTVTMTQELSSVSVKGTYLSYLPSRPAYAPNAYIRIGKHLGDLHAYIYSKEVVKSR